MENIINVTYETTGETTAINEMGMRPMQARAYDARNSQYILLKAPPASGKSRALMFIALDKLKTGTVKKVIVAVPERSIGKSFLSTELVKYGFHSDWHVPVKYNLCVPGGENSKVEAFKEFMNSDETVLLCTHATLRFAFDKIGAAKFGSCLVAVDEFHHVSADYESKLGELVRALMQQENVHILAMTGSYFRGDCIPVLSYEDEAKFYKVTYNYYEQLNGYTYLKSLGIGFHFYSGKYTSAIMEVLDTNKKTILHIPSVNSGESTKDKYIEVDTIIDAIGTVDHVDSETNIIFVSRRTDGKIIKVADLVNDNASEREKVVEYLRNIKEVDDVDLIIALGMAKEGFDWPFCEHALTVGYRGSLTEIIQIIGRCTRDSENKTHAQFTNLIAEPDAESNEVVESVNNMLKAITASLLMEQVLAPNFNFKPKFPKGFDEDKSDNTRTILVGGMRQPSTQNVKNILDSDLTDLKANILQDPQISKAVSGVVDPEVINKIMIPKIIMTKYPHLSENEVEEVREHIVADMVIRSSSIKSDGNRRFIDMSGKFVNLYELNIDLIDSINPFQQAFEVISKSITPKVLKSIQECIAAFKVNMTDDEAIFLWPKINEFVKITRRQPSLDALDPTERRLAEALMYLRQLKRTRRMDEKTNKDKLSEIFKNDLLGLLNVDESKTTPISPQDSRLIDSFQEISDFYETNQRCPKLSDDIGEYRLASRLAAIKKDPRKVKMLLQYDYYNLLESEETKSVSVEELINDDPLGLLDEDNEVDSIYKLSHVKPSERLRPDYIAHRKICKDFDLYEDAFQKIHDDLKHGRRRLVEFKEGDLHEGYYYVLRGVVLYLEQNLSVKQKIEYKSGAKVRQEGRTRCIFDNGTESTMLYRSLGKALKLDGFCISDLAEQTKNSVSIDESDIQNGYIYVLRSLSRTPQIRSIRNLYKIGYSSGDVTMRIKNAVHEPTYLMNDVEVVLTVRCYNLDVPYLESSIHSFFNNVNVYFEVRDHEGIMHYPKEWFTVPLNIIEEVIPLIVNKKIDKYRYDENLQMIIQKSPSE